MGRSLTAGDSAPPGPAWQQPRAVRIAGGAGKSSGEDWSGIMVAVDRERDDTVRFFVFLAAAIVECGLVVLHCVKKMGTLLIGIESLVHS